jgi:hypothetical protein
MPDFSDTTKPKVVDWLCGGSNPVRPTERWLALYTSAPSDAGGGVELSGNGYGRVEITFTAHDGTAAYNDAELLFSASGGDFGLITHGAIFDDETAGAFLMWAALTASKTIPDGDRIRFVAGAVAVGMS